MSEPWKVIICSNGQCMAEAINEDGSTNEECKIYPDVDHIAFTQFICPKCGNVETWGKTRVEAAKFLYERILHARVDE